MSIQTLVGLGRLVELVVRSANGKRVIVRPTSPRWLAWDRQARNLVLLIPRPGRAVPVTGAAAAAHRRFHGDASRGAVPMFAPTAVPGRQRLGLLESCTYTAAGWRSPAKRDFHWQHDMGDRGERGHGKADPRDASTYSERLMPWLDTDSAGSLFIVRRRSNRYEVADWIIG